MLEKAMDAVMYSAVSSNVAVDQKVGAASAETGKGMRDP